MIMRRGTGEFSIQDYILQLSGSVLFPAMPNEETSDGFYGQMRPYQKQLLERHISKMQPHDIRLRNDEKSVKSGSRSPCEIGVTSEHATKGQTFYEIVSSAE